MKRRVLVTGAGSGFGLETSVLLSHLGFDVTGVVPPRNGAGEPDESRQLAEAADRAGVNVEVVVADLADPTARAGLAASRDLWALINNAGYMNAGRLTDVPIDDARTQLEVMVLAPIDLAKQCLPTMAARGHGRIVNITSSALNTSTPLTGWYQACKASLRELNDSLRSEAAPSGVAVIEVEPGAYRTGIWSRAADELEARMGGSDRPDIYRRALAGLERALPHIPGPDPVAVAVADALTTGQPRRHIRIGPGSGALRMADRLVPDWLWDRAGGLLTGTQP